jgi:predicted acyltransferase
MSDQTPTTNVPTASSRLLSLDALRGFDMFWIVGAEDIVHALGKISQRGPVRFLSDQLQHKAWEGVAFYDLIFPLFVYIVGVSWFSLSRSLRTLAELRRCVILKRGILLFLIGICYGGLVRVSIRSVLECCGARLLLPLRLLAFRGKAGPWSRCA